MRRGYEYLVCVDSDGCAMDTMNIKHEQCFGPCLVEVWHLTPWRDEILRRWNEINLYTVSRGINRFQGLVKMLEEADRTYTRIEGLPELQRWITESTELSEGALEAEIAVKEEICLKKALNWSRKVNGKIELLDKEKKRPFAGVKEALGAAACRADVVVVSSANRQAVLEEWERCALLSYTTDVKAQDSGSKAHCIQELLRQGYDRKKVLMVGDAPGDYDAAVKNDVYFYPICVGQEEKSWEEFRNTALDRWTKGTYGGAYQEQVVADFWRNLKG